MGLFQPLNKAGKATGQQRMYLTASRAGARRASTSNSRLRTGMASLKAVLTTLLLTWQKCPAIEVVPRQLEADHRSGRPPNAIRWPTSQWVRLQFRRSHSPSPSRSRIQYLHRLLDHRLMPSFRLHHRLLELMPRSSVHKLGRRHSRIHIGFTRMRKKHPLDVHQKLQSDLKLSVSRPCHRMGHRGHKTSLRRRGQSIRPLQKRQRMGMWMRWISTQAHHLFLNPQKAEHARRLRRQKSIQQQAQAQYQMALLPHLRPLQV